MTTSVLYNITNMTIIYIANMTTSVLYNMLY